MSRDITLAETLYIFFTTRAFATGIPTTLAGTPVVSAYEDDSDTQITAGITLGVDHDSVTGLNLLTIVATGANGFESSKDYTLVVTTGTVGGVSVVGEVVGEFTIGRSAAAVDLANATDGLSALKTLIDAIPTTAMRGTDSAALASVATEARLAELDAANLPADVDDVLGDTADMQPLIEKMAYVGLRGLGVWIDGAAANTNTVLGTDGTPDNPVSTIAAATTIATALGSQRFYLMNSTSITLAQTYEGYEFVGTGISNQITLGSQDVDNTVFFNVVLTGTQGGTQFMRAVDCRLQALLSAEILADDCWLTGDITLRAATNHSFGQCKSGMPGNDTPDLTFPGSGTTSVNFRHYSGGLTLKSGISTDTISYESDGQLIIDASCTSINVTVRGNCSITDNGTTTSLTQDAALSRTSINAEVVDALNVDTYAEVTSPPSAISSIMARVGWLFALSRNKGTQTSTTKTLRNDADGANIGTSAISDDSTTFTRNKWS